MTDLEIDTDLLRKQATALKDVGTALDKIQLPSTADLGRSTSAFTSILGSLQNRIDSLATRVNGTSLKMNAAAASFDSTEESIYVHLSYSPVD